MQFAPTAPGFARSIVRIGPCAHWSEVNALLERLRTLPQLAALDVVGIQDGMVTLDVWCPATLPLHKLIAGSLPQNRGLSVRPAAEEQSTVGAGLNGVAPANGERSAGFHTHSNSGDGGNGIGADAEPRRTSQVGGAHANGALPLGGQFDDSAAIEQHLRAAAVTHSPTAEAPRRAEPEPNGALHPGDERRRSEAAVAAGIGARLLIALDGSRLAEEALGYVAAHFDAGRTEVHLMSVVDQAEAGAMRISIEHSPAASYRRLYLRACAQDLRGFHVRCVVAAHDAPAKAVLAYAVRNVIDLVVMTAHGHSRRAGAPLGSVAEGVVATRRLPVLLLPGGG